MPWAGAGTATACKTLPGRPPGGPTLLRFGARRVACGPPGCGRPGVAGTAAFWAGNGDRPLSRWSRRPPRVGVESGPAPEQNCPTGGPIRPTPPARGLDEKPVVLETRPTRPAPPRRYSVVYNRGRSQTHLQKTLPTLGADPELPRLSTAFEVPPPPPPLPAGRARPRPPPRPTPLPAPGKCGGGKTKPNPGPWMRPPANLRGLIQEPSPPAPFQPPTSWIRPTGKKNLNCPDDQDRARPVNQPLYVTRNRPAVPWPPQPAVLVWRVSRAGPPVVQLTVSFLLFWRQKTERSSRWRATSQNSQEGPRPIFPPNQPARPSPGP